MGESGCFPAYDVSVINNYFNNDVNLDYHEGGNIFQRNFWSDYKGSDKNEDGIGDEPYICSIRSFWVERGAGKWHRVKKKPLTSRLY